MYVLAQDVFSTYVSQVHVLAEMITVRVMLQTVTDYFNCPPV